MQKVIYMLLGGLLFLNSCNKDEYYTDSGIHNPVFNGDMLSYIDSRSKDPKDIFDTLRTVITLAGLEDDFKNKNMTFFAPPDPCIGKAIDALNEQLYLNARDSVTRLDQIKPEAWRRLLQGYMLNGDMGLVDFNQIDTANLSVYNGQQYQALNGDPLNVGVVYHDAVTKNTNGQETMRLKYKGPRQILISYVPEYTTESIFWVNAFISSSNIKPNNGRVHVINYNRHLLGFTTLRFNDIVNEYGIEY